MRYPRVKLDSIKADVPYAFVGGPFGSNLTTRDYVEEGVPVIRGNNQSSVSVFHDDDYVFVSDEKSIQLTPNLAFPGDVIFTQRGTLGQVGVIPKNAKYERYVISQSQMKLTVHSEKAEAMYVYYYFRRPDIVQTIINLSQSSGVPHINLGTLKNFEIPLPPVDVQQRIVSTLSAYDDLIENSRRRIDLLEQSARMLYKEWFVSLRFPGHEHVQVKDGVPQGWEIKLFGDVCQTIGGGTPSTQKREFWDDGNIIWVTPTDVTRNDCLALLDTEKKITEDGLRNSSAKLLPPDTILMTSRASIGFFAMMDKEASTNQGFISIIPNEPVLKMYMLHNLIFRVEEIRSNAGGTTFKEIPKSRFRAMSITIPPKHLLEQFEENVYTILQQTRILKKQIKGLQQARDLLLLRLMNGEISV